MSMLERAMRNLSLAKEYALKGKRNTACQHTHKDMEGHAGESRETMSERAFVRAFGVKARHYRLSNRADFVGLMIYGQYSGFIVVRDKQGRRKLRVLDILPDSKNVHGRVHVTPRYIVLKDTDSLSNLQKGLLKWVA